jgi:thiamine-monophosphate kinase
MRVGEFELIEKIRRRAGVRAELKIGIGDDCSAISVPENHELVTSTDLLLEGVHFCLDWTDLYSLGIKAVAVNISDLAAMGARPVSLHLAVGLPVHFQDEQIEQFLDGIFAGLKHYDVLLAGGDTCRSKDSLVISVTVQGFCHKDRLIMRSGARVGDDIWVSGTLGDSGLALQRLMANMPLSPFLAQRHYRPEARVMLGQQLADRKLATAMLDLSDGLAGDLRHLLKASSVGARVDLDCLPLSKEFRVEIQKDPGLIDLAICGGEDYELLFTAGSEQRARLELLSIELNLPLHQIGVIKAGQELQFCKSDGQNYQPQLSAFDHFGSAGEIPRG